MAPVLDRLHARARTIGPLHRLAVVSRILLAIAFVPTGLTKALGNRFTTLGADNAVGAFFEAMYQTGWYWNLIGWTQVVAGILLVIPRTSTLGAVMFLPILVNITAITWSVGFGGTMYVTLLMLLANVFLVCWDYDRVRPLIFGAPRAAAYPSPPLPTLEKAGYALGLVVGVGLFTAARGLIPWSTSRWFLGMGAAAVLMVLAGWIQATFAARPARSQ